LAWLVSEDRKRNEILKKGRRFQFKGRLPAHAGANAKSSAHRLDGLCGCRDDILRVPRLQSRLLDPAGMAFYPRRALGLRGNMGFGGADHVRGWLVGLAVMGTTSHSLVVGWCSVNRSRRCVGRGCAGSRRPLFRSELNAQQLNLRWGCNADWVVGGGPRSKMFSQPQKSEPGRL